jgi:hypothetical protein
MSTQAAQEDKPWWAAFPEYKSSCPQIEASEVKVLLEADAAAGASAARKFLLVDVRRTDWEGGTVATSLNFPAHTLYQTRPVIYRLCKQAGIEHIIFYCGKPPGRRLFRRREVDSYDPALRKLEWSRASVSGVDAGLSQRSRRDNYESTNPQRWH